MAQTVLIGLVVGAIAGAGTWWLLGGATGGAPSAGMEGAPGAAGGPPGGFGAAPVDVVAAVETVAAEQVELLGTARPYRESSVASEVDGLVDQMEVDEGDAVRAGQVLVHLSTSVVEQQLIAAEASRQETEARLARAVADFERLDSLRERRAISEREYDQAVADRDALAQGVRRLEAEVARLQDELDRATIKAPFAGRVSAVHVELGEWVGRGDQIVALVDLSSVEVQVQVAERYIAAVTPGFEVEVFFDAMPERRYAGRVHAVIPEAVPEARTFPVLVRTNNDDMAVKGGMAARVRAQLGSPTPALLVSKDAIVRRGDQVLLFRVDPGPESAGAPLGEGSTGAVTQVNVQAGPARGAWQVVYGAVSAGDLFVVRGNERVFPGQPVSIANLRTPPVPSADPERPIAVDPRQSSSQ